MSQIVGMSGPSANTRPTAPRRLQRGRVLADQSKRRVQGWQVQSGSKVGVRGMFICRNYTVSNRTILATDGAISRRFG